MQRQLEILLKQFNLSYTLKWNLSGKPFHSKNKVLKTALINSIKHICAQNTHFNTSGGTSDGRFVAPYGVNVVELGLINKTIHQIDEKVLLADVEKLMGIYSQLIPTLLNDKS